MLYHLCTYLDAQQIIAAWLMNGWISDPVKFKQISLPFVIGNEYWDIHSSSGLRSIIEVMQMHVRIPWLARLPTSVEFHFLSEWYCDSYSWDFLVVSIWGLHLKTGYKPRKPLSRAALTGVGFSEWFKWDTTKTWNHSMWIRKKVWLTGV
jgi:hypothetical protein